MTPLNQEVTSATFAVDDVQVAKLPLKEISRQTFFEKLFKNREVIAYSQPDRSIIQDITFQPLLAAIHLAYSGHRPLIISPDAMWLTFAQGFAYHITNNAEALRHLLVPHSGKESIIINTLATPNWEQLIEEFSDSIFHKSHAEFKQLLCDFSTSSRIDTLASRIVLLDAFKPYYGYETYCVCGIPEITLTGKVADWEKLKEKVEFISQFDLDWWTKRLIPICEEFILAAKGNANIDFWQEIYKLRQAYGSNRINGWAMYLIPYVKDFITDRCSQRNAMLSENVEEHYEDIDSGITGLTTDLLPDTPNSAPIVLRSSGEEMEAALELVGGLVGVEQNRETKALKPISGWVVTKGLSFREELLHFSKICDARPPLNASYIAELLGDSLYRTNYLSIPADLVYFYSWCNGAALKDGSLRFLSLEEARKKSDASFEEEESLEGFIGLRKILEKSDISSEVEKPHNESSANDKASCWILAELANGEMIYFAQWEYHFNDDHWHCDWRDECYVQRGEERLIIATSLRQLLVNLLEDSMYFLRDTFVPIAPLSLENIEEYVESKNKVEEDKPARYSKYHHAVGNAWCRVLDPPYGLTQYDIAHPGISIRYLESPGYYHVIQDNTVMTQIGVLTARYGAPRGFARTKLHLHFTQGMSIEPDKVGIQPVELLTAMDEPHEELCDFMATLLAKQYYGETLKPGSLYDLPETGLWCELDFTFSLLSTYCPVFTEALPTSLQLEKLNCTVPIYYLLLLKESEASMVHEEGVEELFKYWKIHKIDIFDWKR
ncbi:MAG: DUF4419 domain-containing protein [Spirochaetota bacterium]